MAQLNAEGLPDEKAAEVPTLYPVWEPGEAVIEGDRRYYQGNGKLYKVRQDHTTQADWTPDAYPAGWESVTK